MAKNKTFKFKNPNTGIVSEYKDTPYFRKMTARIQKKYDNLSAKDKETIRKRIAKREKRAAAQDKLRTEVREGREAGLSMHEIRAKRLGITPEELTRRGKATASVVTMPFTFMIPGGAAVRLATSGGKLTAAAAKQLARLKKAFPKGKVNKKPTKATVDKAVAPSAVKMPTRPTSGPATRGGRRGGKKDEVIEGTAVEKSSTRVTPKPKPKDDKKPGTSVATRPRTDVKKPGTGVMEIRRAGTGPRTMKRVQGSDKPTPKPAVRGPAKATRSNAARNLALAAGAAGAATTAAYLAGKKGDDAVAGGSGTGKKRASPGGVNKGKDPKKTAPRTSGPSTRGSRRPPSADKAPTRKPSGPTTRGSNKRGATKRITAGPNTGFGPKGNIFPSNAAERAALMKMYGGTGSAAAKAAAAGKQGDLKAGKAAYEKAKRARLKGKK